MQDAFNRESNRERYLKTGKGKCYLKNRLRRFLSLTGFTPLEAPRARGVAVVALCGLFLTGFTQVSLANTAQLELSIILDKSEYKTKDEPIKITFKLENKGKEPVWVNKRFYLNSENVVEIHRGEVVLKVTAPSGEVIPCKFAYEIGFPKSDYFELLEPGNEVVSEYPRQLRGYYDFTESGVYEVVAVYQNIFGKEIGVDSFTEKLSSEPVSLILIDSDK